jgi:hypothetical protein
LLSLGAIRVNIRIHANAADSAVIEELLSPWSVSFTEKKADVAIVYGLKPAEAESTVVIPSDNSEFMSWASKTSLQIAQKNGRLFSVEATPRTTLTITPEKQYCFDDPYNRLFENGVSSQIKSQENTVILKVDIIKEFNSIIEKTLNPKQSTFHRVITSLPIPYGLAPTRLRDLIMKVNRGPESLSLSDKLPIDALRYALVNAIKTASGKELEKKILFNSNYICMLTHDVETAKGLKRAIVLKRIEEMYDLVSAWYLPSKRYKLNDDCIRQLSNHGEVGAHDTKHDGKLAHLPKDQLLKRVSEVRQSLERITQQPVYGFRAPILQHNPKILSAINEAGYTYDTSIPTWEPKHPYTMKPHGIGTIYPLTLCNVTEIPLTLPQDHQLLHVLGLNPQNVIKTWASMAITIRDLGGVCTFLVHPDYEIAASTELYEELLNVIESDEKCTVTVPSRMAALMNE